MRWAKAGGETIAGRRFLEGELITREALNAQKRGEILMAVEKAAFRNLAHAAAGIRKTAQESIVRSKKPAQEGKPIHTRFGRATRAILYWSSKSEAVIGFNYSKIGPAMQPHEHGGRRKKQVYKPRPTMWPALEKNVARFHSSWHHSLQQ